MNQLPEDPRSGSVPPPGGAQGGYGGFSPPVEAAAAFNATPTRAGTDVYASRWLRLAGAIIDGVIVSVPAWIIASVADTGTGAALYFIYLLVSVLYAPLLLMREGENNGQTIGKQAVGIRVRHESGEPMTFSKAALREIVGKSLLSAVTCGIYGLIDSLWCLWDKRRQCLHDKIGSTVVTPA